MALGTALVYFGIPAIMFRLSFYYGIPLLRRAGVRWFEAYLIGNAVPLLVLLIAAIAFSRRVGWPLNWRVLAERLRLTAIRPQTWLWVAGGLAVIAVGDTVLSVTSGWLVKLPGFAPPPGLPSPPRGGLFMGLPIAGNW